jgi:hypothetical protein
MLVIKCIHRGRTVTKKPFKVSIGSKFLSKKPVPDPIVLFLYPLHLTK